MTLHQRDNNGELLQVKTASYAHNSPLTLVSGTQQLGLTLVDNQGRTLFTTQLFDKAAAQGGNDLSGQVALPVGQVALGNNESVNLFNLLGGHQVSRTGSSRETVVDVQEKVQVKDAQYATVEGVNSKAGDLNISQVIEQNRLITQGLVNVTGQVGGRFEFDFKVHSVRPGAKLVFTYGPSNPGSETFLADSNGRIVGSFERWNAMINAYFDVGGKKIEQLFDVNPFYCCVLSILNLHFFLYINHRLPATARPGHLMPAQQVKQVHTFIIPQRYLADRQCDLSTQVIAALCRGFIKQLRGKQCTTLVIHKG